MIIKTISLIALAFCLSACSTTSKKLTANSDFAILESGSIRKGPFRWAEFKVEAIDNKEVRYSIFAISVKGKKIKVDPGMRNVVLAGSFNRGQGPFKVRGDLDMHFEAGRKYIASGTIKGSKMVLWINDAETNQPASKSISMTYQEFPTPDTVFVTPLYIGR